jgi:GNAT superfamily N-acetyltransferase
MNIRITPIAVRENLLLLDPLMGGLHDSERSMHPGTALWAEIREGYMRHIMQMQEEEDGTCLLALVDDIPAGFMFGFIEDADVDSRFETYRGKDLYVSDGYVRPEFRRLGLYRTMNNMLEQIYYEKGVRRIHRLTLAENIPMQKLLAHSGYHLLRYMYVKHLGEGNTNSDSNE